MPASLLGELASLATAVLWTGSATFFTIASRRLGSAVLNRTRLLLAVTFLLITHTFLLGTPIPFDAAANRWMWLGLSGVIGLAVGDAMLFQCYVLIGPRLGLLMLSTAPLISTLLAWALLGERLLPIEWLAVLLTILGIAWVILRGRGTEHHHLDAHYVQGIVLGLGAAACQATGLTLSKLGLSDDFPALSGVVIRMLAAFVALWGWSALRGQIGETFTRWSQDRGALLPAVGGAIVGPFLGVWMSLIGVQLARVGVASTIMALPPVFSLPVARFVFKEDVSWQAWVGTLLAMAGIAMLFLI